MDRTCPVPWPRRDTVPTAQLRSGGREAAMHHELRPCAVQVEVVGVAQHGGDLGAGRPHRDLGDGDRAVGTLEPLQVGEPGLRPESAQDRRRGRPDALVLWSADVTGQQHHPLDPRVAQHLQRRGQVDRQRVPDDPTVQHHAVVGPFLAAGTPRAVRAGPASAGPRRATPSGRRRRRDGTCSSHRPRRAA
jgi:hypothetical protein